eukprot:6492632-Amphidinium_carterae.1
MAFWTCDTLRIQGKLCVLHRSMHTLHRPLCYVVRRQSQHKGSPVASSSVVLVLPVSHRVERPTTAQPNDCFLQGWQDTAMTQKANQGVDV